MRKKELMPKCPYCGWEMQHHFDYPMNYCDVRFYCKHCNAMSPSARGCQTSTESVEKALEEAYEKAMRRYEEPNRVLTLDEVFEIVRQNKDGYNHVCWLEKVNVRCISTPGFLGGYGIHSEIYVNFDFYEVVTEYPDCVPAEEYGKTWRCWMRNPTEKELKETPWEDKKNV